MLGVTATVAVNSGQVRYASLSLSNVAGLSESVAGLLLARVLPVSRLSMVEVNCNFEEAADSIEKSSNVLPLACREKSNKVTF